MKTFTKRNISTEVTFLQVSDNYMVNERAIVMDGKVSYKKFKDHADDNLYSYVAGSFRANLIEEVIKIPYNVIEKLVTAAIGKHFVEKADSEIELGTTLHLAKIEEFGTVKYVMDNDGDIEITYIPVPDSVLTEIKEKYVTVTKTNLWE